MAGKARSKDKDKTVEQLVTELERVRKRVAELETSASETERVADMWKASENFYRALIENVSENIMVVKAEGTIAYAGPANERIFGYEPEYLVGRNSLDFLHPDDAQRVIELFDRAVQNPGATRSVECRYRHKDGSWRYVQAVGSSFLDDPTVGGIVINSTDITERKRAQEALKRSEEYFRALIENALDGITVLNADGSIRYQSPSVGRLFGYGPEDEIGNPVFKYVHPGDRQMVNRTFNYVINNPGVTVSVECRYPGKGGSWRWMEAVVRNLLDDPIVGGIVLNYRDVTERKQAQKALRESEKRQEMAVLEERNRIAREIHDTLAQGFAGVVLQLEAADEIIGKDVYMAQQYIDHARRLARENLNEARRSVQDLRPQALEVLSLEDSLNREVRKFSQETGVETTFDILGDVHSLHSDIEVALLRICQESLANVKQHADASEVEANLVFEDDSVSLSIRDNGIGFDTESQHEGSYGLMGMRERVRLLGGALEIRSEKGRGTLVEATFASG